MDDIEMFLSFNNNGGPVSLAHFFSSSGIERYYRPLHPLSFFIDYKIWQQKAGGYHLTNLFFHLMNAMLFYALLRNLLQRLRMEKQLSLTGALLFALHPLTSESVAWISGRTDILASLFCLIAFRVYLTKTSFRYPFISLGLLLGLLAKESAVVLIPILLLSDLALNHFEGKRLKEKTRSLLALSVAILPALLIYLQLRMGGLFHLDRGVQRVMENNVAVDHGTLLDNIGSYLLHFFAATAFYLKKLFIPFPLNFAINQIAILPYFFLFLVLVFFIACLLSKKKYSIPFWLALLLISFSPALLLATSKIAWTPYAERYLYFSCIIWATAMIFAASFFLQKRQIHRSWIQAILWGVVIIWGSAIFQRAFVWQNNLSLWEATINETPNFGKVLYKYGETLYSAGKKEEGLQMYRKTVEIAKDNEWKSHALIALGNEAVRTREYDLALHYFQQALASQPDGNSHLALAAYYSDQARSQKGAEERYRQQAIYHYREIYKQTANPSYLYTIGEIALEFDPNLARESFREVIKKHPHSKYANLASKKLEHPPSSSNEPTKNHNGGLPGQLSSQLHL